MGTLRREPHRIREFFLLENAIRKSSTFSDAQLQSMRVYHDEALRRLQSAQDLRALWRTPVALKKYQEAAMLSAIAILVAKNQEPDPNLAPADAFDRLERLLDHEQIELAAPYLRAKPTLIASDLLQRDPLPPSEVQHEGQDLEATVRWLASFTDPRSTAQLRLERALRIGGFALALGAVLYWSVAAIRAPRNVAQGSAVAAPDAAFRTTSQGVVDGRMTGAFDYHSLSNDHPWLVIDLGRPHRIERVKVFGRGDCCFDQSTPLALSISDDGVSFRKVGERSEPFSQLDPWVVDSVGTGRYVRLEVERSSYLVLSEVEVYGRRVK
jgi:hypothetical protein